MTSSSKRYKAAKKLINDGVIYAPAEALAIIAKQPSVKFDASIEVHLRLGIDVKQANQLVRSSAVLPHGTGRSKRIAVFCNEVQAKAALAAGAAIVGGEDLIKEIKDTGKCDFEIAIATPEMMKLLAPIAKTLGQKGLMPNPKTDTITTDVVKAVENLNKGKINFKADDTGNVHQVIGRVSFDAAKLLENFKIFIDAVKRARPAAAKGVYIISCTLSTSMGPGIKVNVV